MVDGNGLSKIEDPSLATAILDRVNNMNADTAIRCFLAAGTFALLPHSSSVALVGSGILFGILYAIDGKLPAVE